MQVLYYCGGIGHNKEKAKFSAAIWDWDTRVADAMVKYGRTYDRYVRPLYTNTRCCFEQSQYSQHPGIPELQ